jgi:hypothetical protein
MWTSRVLVELRPGAVALGRHNFWMSHNSLRASMMCHLARAPSTAMHATVGEHREDRVACASDAAGRLDRPRADRQPITHAY